MSRAARRAWIVLGVVAVCAGAALVLALVRSPVYRAETKIVIRQGSGSAATSARSSTTTLRDLVESEIVARNVVESLGLKMSPHELLGKVSTSADSRAAVVKIFVDDHDKVQAVRIDQQVAAVFTQLVQDRFTRAGSQPLTATVFDPAHLQAGKVSPRPVRDVAIAVGLGLVLGLAAVLLRDRRAVAKDTPGADPGGRKASAQVAALEKLLASRNATIDDLRRTSGEATARVAALERLLASRDAAVERLRAELEHRPGPEAPPAVEAQPPAPAVNRRDIAALERLASQFPDDPRAEEWATYAGFLREHADSTGLLPPAFDAIVDEVYGDLIARAGGA